MIKKSLVFLSISAAFFAQAQDATVIRNSVDVYGNSSLNGSSKYNAMAGSMGALGGDVSVLNSNPAGIGVSIAGDISGTLSIGNSQNTTTFGGASYVDKTNKTDLGQVGATAVFEISKQSPWKFVNIGVNYSNQSIDDYNETPGNQNVTFDIDNGADTAMFDGHAYNRSGDLSKMSLGVGANYDNRIYVGAGLNFHGSTLNQYDTARMIYASDNASEIFNKQYTPYYEEGTGFSASVGVIGKVNNQFRLGAAIETPTWWNIDRAYQYYDKADAANDGQYSENQKFTSPMKATLSAAFVPSKNLALNVDYSLGLTKPKFSHDSQDVETELNNFYDANYKSISEVKVGAEYRIQQFRLRGGYGFASSPFNSSEAISVINTSGANASQAFDDLYVGKRNTVGAGIGYDFKSFYIDAAYQNVSSTYSSPFMKGSTTAGTEYYSDTAYIGSEASIVSEVKNKQNNIFITLGWKF
ncbi:hemin receptor [uncultured Chryseobacterium sp.]|uniref:OmpP1/FadL family transporter n=1 Tax=uncultured Chryseobacterium sp. TaxID=259322 RepID=UPI0026250AC0|nr:hemin receptor [uncultured Chryseobacterium sp.]